MPPHHSRPGPWFRRHPHLAVTLAVVLFASITVMRLATGSETDATTLLFVLPIALLAQAFGSRVGTLASVPCIGVLVWWVATNDVDLSPLGWVTRIVPMVLLGALIGRASDQQRDAEELATNLAVSEERQREAAEINDVIVQNLAVAKWKLEAGDVVGGIDMLDETIGSSQGLVTKLLGGLRISNGDRRRSRRMTPLG